MGDDTPAFQDLYPGWFVSYKADVVEPGSKYASALLQGEWGITKGLPNNLFPRQTATSRSVRGLASLISSFFEQESE